MGLARAWRVLTPDNEEHASGVWFPLTSVGLSSLSFELRLTMVINYEQGWAQPCQVTSPATAIDLLPHDPINLVHQTHIG